MNTSLIVLVAGCAIANCAPVFADTPPTLPPHVDILGTPTTIPPVAPVSYGSHTPCIVEK